MASLFPCPECGKNALFYIKGEQVEFECRCNTKKELSLKEFITTIKISNCVSKCVNHKEKQIEIFCCDCNEEICAECANAHSAHKVVQFAETFNTEKIGAVKIKITEAHQYINTYLKYLKDWFINHHKERIKILEDAFAHADDVNQMIIKALEMLMEGCNGDKVSSYYASENLINNSYFKFRQFYRNNEEELVKFLMENVIIENGLFKKKKLDANDLINWNNLQAGQSIQEHQAPVNCLFILKDGRLASCADDKTIKIYNESTFKCEITLTGHTDAVFYISQLENGDILSSSKDKTIKIWSITKDSFTCKATILGHTKPIWKVIPLSKERIASCSQDTTIQIWNNTSPYENIQTLKDHVNWVNSIIQLNGKEILVSASQDNIIKFWNLENYKCENTITNVYCTSWCTLYEIKDNNIIIGGSQIIAIIDTITRSLIKEIKDAAFDFIDAMIPMKNYVLFSCNYGDLYKYDIASGEYRFLAEKAHKWAIYSFAELKEGFATCSYDKVIKIWS